MATIDTKVDNLVIWTGTKNQIDDAIEQGVIEDKSIAIATDVSYVKPNELGNGVLTIKKNGTTIGTFSANSKQDVEVGFSVINPVQSDWNEENQDALDYIKNKPVMTSITVKRFE